MGRPPAPAAAAQLSRRCRSTMGQQAAYFAAPPEAAEYVLREQAQSLLYRLLEGIPEEARYPHLGDVQVEQGIEGAPSRAAATAGGARLAAEAPQASRPRLHASSSSRLLMSQPSSCSSPRRSSTRYRSCSPPRAWPSSPRRPSTSSCWSLHRCGARQW